MVRGLIVNPRSGKASGKGLELASRLKAHPQVIVRVLETFSQLNPFIAEMAEAGVTDLFVSSGDGTVQAIQTEIAERHARGRIVSMLEGGYELHALGRSVMHHIKVLSEL